MKISVVIPFYNEERMIEKMYSELVHVLNQQTKEEFEIILIDDGSKDKTFEKILEIAKNDDRVRYLSFSRNFGKEAGTIAGLQYATGEAVILMDGDLQHPPALVPQMIKAYREGYDVVSGRRTRTGESQFRTFLANRFYKLANRLMDTPLTDGISEFRLFSRKAVRAILSLNEYNRFSKGLFSWNYAIQGILSFNDKPLRACINLGLGCLLISVLYIVWMFVKYLIDPTSLVSGYFTTIFAVVLLGGIQLISIGVLGEYIGKIYYEVKKRPHYLVDKTNFEEEKDE